MKNEIDLDYPQFIRIDTSIKNKFLVEIIDKNSGTCFAGQEQGEICLLAATIGFLAGKKKKSNKSTDIRLYKTLKDEYKVLIRAIALLDSKYNYDILYEGLTVLKTIEEYANGGFPILYEKIHQKGFDLSIEEEVLELLNKI